MWWNSAHLTQKWQSFLKEFTKALGRGMGSPHGPILCKGWAGCCRQQQGRVLTTGLWTSQNALSWLSRIFLSILSLFLSTLSTSQQWTMSVNCRASLDPRGYLEHTSPRLTRTHLACASACMKMNSHFRAKALCSLAKLSWKTHHSWRHSGARLRDCHLVCPPCVFIKQTSTEFLKLEVPSGSGKSDSLKAANPHSPSEETGKSITHTDF